MNSHGIDASIGLPTSDRVTVVLHPWCSHGAPMRLPSELASTVLPWCLHEASMVLPWDFHGVSGDPSRSHRTPMGLPRDYSITPVVIRRDFHGIFMVCQWCSHGNSIPLAVYTTYAASEHDAFHVKAALGVCPVTAVEFTTLAEKEATCHLDTKVISLSDLCVEVTGSFLLGQGGELNGGDRENTQSSLHVKQRVSNNAGSEFGRRYGTRLNVAMMAGRVSAQCSPIRGVSNDTSTHQLRTNHACAQQL